MILVVQNGKQIEHSERASLEMVHAIFNWANRKCNPWQMIGKNCVHNIVWANIKMFNQVDNIDSWEGQNYTNVHIWWRQYGVVCYEVVNDLILMMEM